MKKMQEIVTLRMTGLKVFEPDAIQLAARKVRDCTCMCDLNKYCSTYILYTPHLFEQDLAYRFVSWVVKWSLVQWCFTYM